MTVEVATFPRSAGFSPVQYAICLKGIVWREGLLPGERFVAALVRPLVWLFIFATGFRQVLGVSIIPPYETYVLYEVYITPGLMLLIQLFNGMQSSLSMVYDREMGNMRTLLVSPLPRCVYSPPSSSPAWRCRCHRSIPFSPSPGWGDRGAAAGICRGAAGAGAHRPHAGRARDADVVVSKQLENFAGAMNFVIFPMFFASSALYPLWRVKRKRPRALLHMRAQSLHPRGRARPLRALSAGQLDLARRGRRLHGAVHGGSDSGLRSVARISRPARRAGRWRLRHRHLVIAAALTLAAPGAALAADPRYPDWPCAQIKVPGLHRRGVGGSAYRRRRLRLGTRSRDQRSGGATRRAPHAAGGCGEEISEVVTGSAAERQQKAKLIFTGLFNTLNQERSE